MPRKPITQKTQIIVSVARIGVSVMMTSYVKEEDEQLRQRSCRLFRRIRDSLAPQVAQRYGCIEPTVDPLKVQLGDAVANQNWPLVAKLSAELAEQENRAS